MKLGIFLLALLGAAVVSAGSSRALAQIGGLSIGSPDCSVQFNGQVPSVACAGIQAPIGTKPLVVGRTVIPPVGTSSCTATNLQPGQQPSVECSSTGQNKFGLATTIELPTGEISRCEFSATSSGEVLTACVGIPLVQPPPLISGDTLNPPPGTNSCTASKASATATPTATCTPASPGEPTLPSDFTFTIPAGRCEIQAQPGGAEPLIGCVGTGVQASGP